MVPRGTVLEPAHSARGHAIVLTDINDLARWASAEVMCQTLRRDNYRAFFEHVFPLLLRRIFGYDGPSWLSAIAAGDREADAYALTNLLSPNGALAGLHCGSWKLAHHTPRDDERA